IDVDFFFDPTHEILEQYPITPKQLLLQTIAEESWLRDNSMPIQRAYQGLVLAHMGEERINVSILQERAEAIVLGILDQLTSLLGDSFTEVKALIEESEPELEQFTTRILEQAPFLLRAFQDSTPDARETLSYVPAQTLGRIISRFPAQLFDGILFNQ